MNRKTLIALATFAVLSVVALIALRQPDKGERASDRPRPIAKIDPATVESLEVTKNGTTTVIKKEGAKYKVIAPVTAEADEAVAKAAFEAVGNLNVSDLVTEQKAKHAEFEVDDKAGIRLVVKKQGGQPLADLVIGKTTGPGTMVRLTGKDQIWQASGLSRYVVDKTAADWRDKSITTFAVADAEQLEVKARDGSKVVAKKTDQKENNEDKWEVLEASPKVDKLDNSVPSGIVSALAVWKANDFADNAKPEEAGLDNPALTITVALKGGKKATVLLGNKKAEDEIYAKSADAPQIFVVKKYNTDRVNKRPIDFRDKTLCDLVEGAVAEIAVTNGANSYTLVKSGNDWKATKPAKLDIDQTKVTPIAGAFKEWKASGFAEDPSPKATGLAKPKATIVVKGKDKAGTCAIKVGDETKDKLNYHVQSASKPGDVLLAPKWNVDRVLVKTDDLKKTPTATVAGGHP